jgi:hypothetical protein
MAYPDVASINVNAGSQRRKALNNFAIDQFLQSPILPNLTRCGMAIPA